jgi:hypothetical protein
MIIDSPLMKQTTEDVPWTIDCGFLLSPPSLTITGAVFAATEIDAYENAIGALGDATSEIASGNEIIDGQYVTQMLTGGEHGHRYMLEIEITRSDTRTFQAERILDVRDVPAPPL